ncbi:cyclic-phosphate processing receiver domain-containing protein [Nonomuraea sp. CA-143628]|uniref:cyclic-phosphate processing receiver domain-containing protein n=1 Tax=Nonomuraea sp. CA-143628 TaxID=3239997 RepID=UPI003D921D75
MSEPLILGIDDLRPLPRTSRVARTSEEGIQLLQEHRDGFIDELWLDHDLGGDDSIMRVVTLLGPGRGARRLQCSYRWGDRGHPRVPSMTPTCSVARCGFPPRTYISV